MNNEDFKILTGYVLSYNSYPCLNTDLIEDWTMELINLGYESDAVFMLASFSKPISYYEIESYLKVVFRELNLIENDKLSAKKSLISYHLNEIVNLKRIRYNLTQFIDLYYDSDTDFEITDFYLLFHGWDELEELGENYYYEGADLDNIEGIIIEKAKIWLEMKK